MPTWKPGTISAALLLKFGGPFLVWQCSKNVFVVLYWVHTVQAVNVQLSSAFVMWIGQHANIRCVSQKLSKIVYSKLCQIFTNFDNCWHKDGQDDSIDLWGILIFILIFTSPNLYQRTTVKNADDPDCCITFFGTHCMQCITEEKCLVFSHTIEQIVAR